MSEKEDPLTYAEFARVCEESGISPGAGGEAQLRADFGYGKALAELADQVISATESEPAVAGPEHLMRLESLVNELYGDGVQGDKREAAIELACTALRYAAEYLSGDEGRN